MWRAPNMTGATYWAPSPRNILHLDPNTLNQGSVLADQLWDKQVLEHQTRVKNNLLRIELDHVEHSQLTLNRDLEHGLAAVSEYLRGINPENPKNVIVPGPCPSPQEESPPLRPHTVLIFPGDPGFQVTDTIQANIWPLLYMQQQKWLPSFGPWYSRLTTLAMQKRAFPRELRGSANFQNSMSLKLMQTVSNTICNITSDFYSDARNLPDSMAALCLLSAYACKTLKTAPPATVSDLLGDIPQKVQVLVSDLKKCKGPFRFSPNSREYANSLAPPRQEGRYNAGFFDNHSLYNLLVREQILVPPESAAPPQTDILFTITASIFDGEIPPFMSHQWNLRAGLTALSHIILLYLLLESPSGPFLSPHPRLNLQTLLGDSFKQPHTSASRFALLQGSNKDHLFSFLITNYMKPVLVSAPTTPMSKIFPGIYILTLEAGQPARPTAPFVPLGGTSYAHIFEIISQSMVIKNMLELVHHKSLLRMTCETGSGVLLEAASPQTVMRDILNIHFMGVDAYDAVYFSVLGALPVTVAVS
ncbi:tegument protein [Cricetid gammaherpesvirus 2]|uniref:Tegument protein n=1 Tax=Cricetid gammaherpesvirus 2 TaxID=1605972 RepID=E9M5K2_9GAMA|nr:tegument protein [Cricetid gammaherpesvirus 2]ADW24360.1 tegument protein [Cricetid gammaherpesvirus 2]ADW24442.1 tegument protein [Cricetid gammaherpesvirus 2]